MRSLNSFTNHVSGLSTKAIEASAHRFHSITPRVAARYIPADPSKFFLSNPSLLSARRGYPNSALTASMNNRKTPFGFKIQNIGVRNQFGSQRINNFDYITAQHKFWSQPEDVNKKTENGAQHQVAHNLYIVVDNPQAIRCEEGNQYIRSTSPSEVASGSKGFIHHPSIAGEGK